MAEERKVLLKVENCYFGNNNVDKAAKTNIYNLINMHCKLATGSYVKNCYFAKDVCTQNIISMFDCEEDAVITIANNIFEKSSNAISITLKGNPKAKIVIENNEYLETDANEKYAGTGITAIEDAYGKAAKYYTINKDGRAIANSGTRRVWLVPIMNELDHALSVAKEAIDKIENES